MIVMTPSETLTAAADRIRDLAAAATRGPWETIGDSGGIWREASPERALRTSPGSLGSMDAAENARWIAALSPATAGPLEAILRATAHDVEVSSMVLNSVQFKAALADRFAPALDLAGAILGSGVDTHA